MSCFGISQKDEYKQIKEADEKLNEFIEERDQLNQAIEQQKILIHLYVIQEMLKYVN